ncbi:MAG TPA: amidase [Candidatus Acidoferrales bacterium]|nr:amidase [Candidatus Acidoferrales bacterium]
MTIEEALARIAENDAELHAWAHVDRGARASGATGPLAGMPFGVKDIIAVQGMPTRFGLGTYEETPLVDAWCVAAVRAFGAVPVGKTWTTALAFIDPAPTRNPHHADRTPGGSSSGSAAAVAAGHVPFAFGTQTIGSVTRPAAYCGIVGYKPTFGSIPSNGVNPLAPSLDHVGILAATAEIAARVADVFIGVYGASIERPHIGFAPTLFAERFPARVVDALEACAARLTAAGAALERVVFPEAVPEAATRAPVVLEFEAHAVLKTVLAHNPPPKVADMIRRGASIGVDAYHDVLAWREASRPQIEAVLGRYDAVLVPVADAAPSRETTGDAIPSSPWTFWGFPALSFPTGAKADGLPIGAMLVAPRRSDAQLLAVARWIERVLA